MLPSWNTWSAALLVNTAGNLWILYAQASQARNTRFVAYQEPLHYGSCAYINFETLGSVQGETIAFVTYYAYDDIY